MRKIANFREITIFFLLNELQSSMDNKLPGYVKYGLYKGRTQPFGYSKLFWTTIQNSM